MNDEQWKLVTDNLQYVRKLAAYMYKRVRRKQPFDDLYQSGVIGMINAAKAFDSSRGIVFRGFARLHVIGAMVDYIREWNSRRNTTKSDLEFVLVGLFAGDHFNKIGSTDPRFDQIEAIKDIEVLSKDLTRKEKEFIEILSDGFNAAAAAEIMGVIQARTSQLKKSSFAKMRMAASGGR